MSAGDTKQILVVDDSQLVLDAVSTALESAGFGVNTARDLGELERCVASGDLDLVLMDVQMPELFGDDVASVLRDVRGLDAPIYLLSDLDASELSSRAADAGIDGYICKREGVEMLVARVQSILESRQ